MSKTFSAVVHKEDNLYVAQCLEVGTTTSQGSSVDEAVCYLQEATELYLEECLQKESPRSILTTSEVAVNA